MLLLAVVLSNSICRYFLTFYDCLVFATFDMILIGVGCSFANCRVISGAVCRT